MALASPDGKREVIVPRYDEIKPGMLLNIVELVGLTKSAFIGFGTREVEIEFRGPDGTRTESGSRNGITGSLLHGFEPGRDC